jgi:hypothetical protein
MSSKKTAVVEVSTTKVLDSTPAEAKKAKKALEALAHAKTVKAEAEKVYAKAQAELYEMLGYTKVGSSWIGIATEGTIAGVPVVVIGTQTRDKFDKEGLLKANPHLIDLFENFTSDQIVLVMKTPHQKNEANLDEAVATLLALNGVKAKKATK